MVQRRRSARIVCMLSNAVIAVGANKPQASQFRCAPWCYELTVSSCDQWAAPMSLMRRAVSLTKACLQPANAL